MWRRLVALGKRSNEFVVREGSIKSARFVLRTCLIRREGRAGSAMPLQKAKVRSSNRGLEGTADERTSNSGSTAGDGRHRPKPLVPEVGPGGTDRAVKLLARRRRKRA